MRCGRNEPPSRFLLLAQASLHRCEGAGEVSDLVSGPIDGKLDPTAANAVDRQF
jgi:hypothetical protein